jgi:hypothetical protein
MCPDGKIPEYIPTYSFPVCIYGRYPATATADGLECRNGGRLVERECILFEEAMIVPCSPTPQPSASSAPKPIISATITIEIKTNMTFTNTTNTTVLEDPQVVATLREAIAKALGVPVEMILIESIQLVKDGIVQTTVNVLQSQGQGQGRRLAVQNGYGIQYKIVDPPASILSTPVEELGQKIVTSPALAAAAIQTIQDMTGVTLDAQSIAIESSNMVVALPEVQQSQTIQQSQQSPSDSSSLYFMIGGVCVAVGLVGIGAALLIAKRRRSTKIVNKTDVEHVTIINPVVPGEPAFFPAPRYFNQSVRDIVHHKPQQIRRI